MFDLFTILYFTPFYFPNGKSVAKNKYFVPICKDGDTYVFVYLPTSKDYVPDNVLSHGCIEIQEKNISCFVFEKDRVVTNCGFSFPMNTFIYMNQINEFLEEKLTDIYVNEDVDYSIIGKLKDEEIRALVDCVISSPSVKRKVKKILKSNFK